MSTTVMQRVYVWHVPVRLSTGELPGCHRVIVTGSSLGGRCRSSGPTEASSTYSFGTAGSALCSSLRVLFNSLGASTGLRRNKYARWDNFIPLTRRSAGDMKEVKDTMRVDILQARCSRWSRSVTTRWPVDLLPLVPRVPVPAVTGFAMYSAMSHAWLPSLFAWVVPLMGGDFASGSGTT